MKKPVKVSIVHDELGNIVAVNRVSHGIQAIVLSGSGQSVLDAEVEEESALEVLHTHRVDVAKKALVAN